MIDVFETWFNQFSKVEQEKLLKHILKNHALVSNDYSICRPEKIDKNNTSISSNEPSRTLRRVKSVAER